MTRLGSVLRKIEIERGDPSGSSWHRGNRWGDMIARAGGEPLPPFRLVGDRPYVQASQMVAHASDRIARETGVVAPLAYCTFRRLTAETLALSEVPAGSSLADGAIGSARFATPEKMREIAFFPTGCAAQRAPQSTSWALAPPRHDGGAIVRTFDDVVTFEDVIEVAISAVKRWHADLATDIEDIWFTGCRDADLRPPTVPNGEVRVTPLRTLVGGMRHQTMTSVNLQFGDGSMQTAVVGFAFRSELFGA